MPQIPQNPLVLVDGSSYLFRAFHAMPPLTNSKGMPTGAIYGVINMLKSLMLQFNPQHIGVIFDAKGKTFRDDLYTDYKANRPPMDPDLRCQIEPLHDIIRALGLPIYAVPGVEADDVIGTLSKRASAQGIFTVISTGDKDMAQLVDERTVLINTMTNTFMDIEGVNEKFGVGPDLIIDFLALKGDKVDNIPGVPGVGDKSAVGLLQGIGGINDIYQRLDDIATLTFRGAKTLSKKMLEHEEQARLSYELATIKLDCELDFSIDDLLPKEQNNDQLVSLFSEYELKRWLNDAQAGKPFFDESQNNQSEAKTATTAPPVVSTEPVPEKHYYTVTTESVFNDLLVTLNAADLICLDTETTSVNAMDAELVGLSFAVKANEAFYIPLSHDYPGAPEQLDKQRVLQQLRPILESASIKKVGQNLKYDSNVLRNCDIALDGIVFDTMLESYVLNSTSTRHNMDSLAAHYLQHSTTKFEDIAGKGVKQLTFNQIAIEQASPYACEDADITLQLHQHIWPQLQEQSSLTNLLTELEVPLVNILANIERNGVLVDSQQLAQQTQYLSARVVEIQSTVHELAGEVFNLGSTKQLQDILFNKMALPIIKKTPKGAPSTGEEVLMELAEQYELPKLIMEYRGLTKLISTYTDKLPKMINHRTGRIHTSYHQAVTATGRLSSSDPNLQNIPIRTEEGQKIRQAFIARPGYKIVAADYSQVELRIMAHLSQDEGLINAFKNKIDVHSATASEIFSTPLDSVTSDQRRSAKAINFGLIYGMSAFGLAKQLNIPRHEAQNYMDLYFSRYPKILEYMDTARVNAEKLGYVQTVRGRRLHLPDIKSRNGARRKAAERAAINAPMQGTAADIIKQAMIAMQDWLNKYSQNDEVFMIMQVHDELVFEVKESHLDNVTQAIKQVMEQAGGLSVALEVEVGTGDNWQQAH